MSDVRPPPPTDPAFYGEEYYARQLHARHWFRNNAAKFRMRWDNTLRLAQLQPADVLVELGCASGEHTLRLAPLVARAIGVDFSPAAIAMARAGAAAAGSRAEFVQSDVAQLDGFADASADKVLALDLVEHVPDAVMHAMFDEAWRILRPGGRLVVFTPCASHYVERLKAANVLLKQLPGHIAVRDEAAYARALGRQRWQSVQLECMPSAYPVFGWLDRMMMRAPVIGALFRFRIFVLAIKPG